MYSVNSPCPVVGAVHSPITMPAENTLPKPLPPDSLSVESRKLDCPELSDVAKGKQRFLLRISHLCLIQSFFFAVLESALAKNFADASVKVCQCPDLTQEPFGLAAKGWFHYYLNLNCCNQLHQVSAAPRA